MQLETLLKISCGLCREEPEERYLQSSDFRSRLPCNISKILIIKISGCVGRFNGFLLDNCISGLKYNFIIKKCIKLVLLSLKSVFISKLCLKLPL